MPDVAALEAEGCRPMPHILFVNSVARWGGGAEASLLALASALRDVGYGCSVLTTAEGSLAARVREAGLDVVLLPMRYFRRWNPWAYYVTGPAALAGVLRDRRISLVHTNCEESIAPVVKAASSVGIPVVCHIRDWQRGWFRPHVLQGLGRADAIVAVSAATRDMAASRGVARNLVHVVCNGVDGARIRAAAGQREAMRSALGLEPHEVAACIIGRVAPSKGQADLIEAAMHPALREAAVRFFVIGDDWTSSHRYDRQLQRRAAELGVDGRVRFLGARDNVPALLAACDLNLAPFLHEAFGRVLVEGFAAGLPAVAYAHGGIPEVVRHGVDGLLVTPGDVAGLAGAIASLAGDPARRAEMAENARARAELFTLERHVAGMREIYEQVLRKGSMPSDAPAGSLA